MAARRAQRTTAVGRVGQAASWLVTTAMVLVLGAVVLVPRLVGATPFTVVTGSMEPGLPPGTLVVVKPIDADKIRTGMVVTYQLRSGDPTVVTHRVVSQGVRPDGTPIFRTQGDANDVADRRWVRPEQVRGELLYAVPHLGRVNTLVTASQRQVALAAVVTALLGYAITMFGGAVRDRRRAKDTSDTKEVSRVPA